MFCTLRSVGPEDTSWQLVILCWPSLFSSPKDAIDEFVSLLRQGKLEQMLSAFAIDVPWRRHDFRREYDKLGAFVPKIQLWPTNSPLSVQLNLEKRRSAAREQIESFVYGLLTGRQYDETFGNPGTESSAQSSEMQGFLDSARLSGLSLMDASKVALNVKQAESLKNLAEIDGGDQLEEFGLLLGLDNHQFVGGITFIKFSTGYQIYGLGALTKRVPYGYIGRLD